MSPLNSSSSALRAAVARAPRRRGASRPSRTDPDELLAPWQADDLVHLLDPRLRFVAERAMDFACAGVGEQHVVAVLQPVHLLQHHRARVGPVHPRDVEVARLAGRAHPGRPAAGRGHDPDADRGVGRAGLGIRELRHLRIERVGVVDQREALDAGGVELPVGDGAAVRAPAVAVADAEFLLVDPVGGAVDDVAAAIARQRVTSCPWRGPRRRGSAPARRRRGAPSGENLANISEASGPSPPSFFSAPAARSSTQ